MNNPQHNLTQIEQKPEHQVLLLPADRWIGKARHVAQIYFNQRTEKTRARYYRDTVDRIREQLIRIGADTNEAERQVDLFFKAVRLELDAINHSQVQAPERETK